MALAISFRDTYPNIHIRGIFSPTFESLYRLGMGGAIPWKMGRWWTFVTGTYLHGNLIHLAFNFIWLLLITSLVIGLFGPGRFFVIYTLSGVGGAIVTVISGTDFFVGASGAILGLFGALIYYGSHRGGTFGTHLFRLMVVFSLLAFLYGFITPGIDNWGHLGGLVSGILVAFLIGYQDNERDLRIGRLLTWSCGMGVITCFLVMIYYLV